MISFNMGVVLVPFEHPAVKAGVTVRSSPRMGGHWTGEQATCELSPGFDPESVDLPPGTVVKSVMPYSRDESLAAFLVEHPLLEPVGQGKILPMVKWVGNRWEPE